MNVPVFIATAAGIGYARRAPGTMGSVAAGLVALVAIPLLPASMLQLAVIGIALGWALVGFVVCPAAARHFGISDPQQVVIDEVAGVWWAIALLPPGLLQHDPAIPIIISVTIFRVFDIAKPWPMYWLERLPGPASIMVDDLVAGIIAGLATTAILS